MCDFFRREGQAPGRKHDTQSVRLDIAAETSETLLRDIHARIVPEGGQRRTEKDFWDGLQKGWATWGWAQHHRDKEYIEGFSLIVRFLTVIAHFRLPIMDFL
jgi:hypothetical protein